MDKVLDELRSKRLIFTVTTGRSGTSYLSYLMSLLSNVKSEHENEPAFHTYYRKILRGEYSFREFWIEKKLPYIAALPQAVYFDASHIACKGFFEFLLELDLDVSFIFLKRNNRQVAKSLLKLNTIPGRTKLGTTYLNSPFDEEVLQIDGNVDDLTDYQLCYWYTLEIDRRIEYYKMVFDDKQIPFVEVSFNQLTKGEGFQNIRESLKLPKYSLFGYLRFIKNRQKPINSKIKIKKEVGEINWDQEEKDIKLLLE